MPPNRQIAFYLEDFALETPAQQIFDRFLFGYRYKGEYSRFRRDHISVSLALQGEEKLLELTPEGLPVAPAVPFDAEAKAREVANAKARTLLDLRIAQSKWPFVTSVSVCSTYNTVNRGSTAPVVIIPRASSATPSQASLTAVLRSATPGTPCFIFGALAPDLATARTFATLAAARQITLATGTFLPVTWRLPQVDLPANAPVDEALIVVQGASPLAELHALDGLLPVLERRAGGERGVRRVKFLAGQDLWRAGDRREWSWGLLSAALSRSDSPQGDTLVDGRTQDLVGLGLVPKLATNPRGWLLEHADGVRTALLALDGVVADFNFAVRLGDGSEVSAQLFRAPVPAQEHFSPLAAVIEDFFRTGEPPWPASRALLTAGLLGACRQAAARPGVWLGTPELAPR